MARTARWSASSPHSAPMSGFAMYERGAGPELQFRTAATHARAVIAQYQ